MEQSLAALYARKPVIAPALRNKLATLSAYHPLPALSVTEKEDDTLLSHLTGVTEVVEAFYQVASVATDHLTLTSTLSRVISYLRIEFPTTAPYPSVLTEAMKRLNGLRTPYAEGLCAQTLSVRDVIASFPAFPADLSGFLDKIQLLLDASTFPLWEPPGDLNARLDDVFRQFDAIGVSSDLTRALGCKEGDLQVRLAKLLDKATPRVTDRVLETPRETLTWPLVQGNFQLLEQLHRLLPYTLRARILEADNRLRCIYSLREASGVRRDKIDSLLHELYNPITALHSHSYLLLDAVRTLLNLLATTLTVQWEYLFYHLEQVSTTHEHALADVVDLLHSTLEE